MKPKILLEINQKKPKQKLQSNAKFSNPRLPQQKQQLHITTTTTTPTNNATTTSTNNNKQTLYNICKMITKLGLGS